MQTLILHLHSHQAEGYARSLIRVKLMHRLAQLVISSLAYWFGGTGKEERSHWTGILISASDSTQIVFSVTKAPGIFMVLAPALSSSFMTGHAAQIRSEFRVAHPP